MSKNQDKIWVSAEQLEGQKDLIEQSQSEFYNLPILNEMAEGENDHEPHGSSRRDFLKYAGFSLGAATIAASCTTPVRRALPYTEKPDTIVPGVATYYASHFVKGGDFCPVLVKTREGRPIKVEGNRLSTLTEGATTARAQASVLELYDTSRFQKPCMVDGDNKKEIEWSDVIKDLNSALGGKKVAIVGNTNLSYSENKAIQTYLASNPNATYHIYDPISASALVQTHLNRTGVRGVPFYDFSKADTIVSIGADFLGTWIAPVIFAKQFSKTRNVENGRSKMSHLVSVESTFSLTGSNADDRIQIRPSEQGEFIQGLYGAIVGGGSSKLSGDVAQKISKLAEQLKAGNGLVVSDSNNLREQEMVAEINEAIGAYGTTISADTLFTRQGLDSELAELAQLIKSGSLDAIIFINDANPVYDSPYFAGLEDSLKSISTRINFGYLPTETSALCNYVLPIDHPLEAWNDVMPSSNSFGFVQPTIQRLFDSRSIIECFQMMAGSQSEADRPELDYIQANTTADIAPLSGSANTASLWTNSVHDGVMQISGAVLLPAAAGKTGTKISQVSASDLELKVYEPLSVGNGSYANNPWLQELPDPITRVVWDNPLQVPIKWDKEANDFIVLNKLNKDGLIAELKSGDKAEQLPIVRQFGQQSNTISTALGYGRSHSGKVANEIGKNLYHWLPIDTDGNVQYYLTDAAVSEKVGVDKKFASVQHHHTYGVTGEVKEGGVENVDERKLMTVGPESQTNFQGGITDRSIIRQSTLEHLDEAIEHLKHEREHHQHLNDQQIYAGYDDLYANGHHWGLSIDLSKCIGCAACQVACVAENNVPVVGKREVSRHHEMTWMRIDRYYYGDANNPSVVYQPMMCQHCDNAPCENVCPVNATNHSMEGLNQMTYNRCIGTRYCANNCPYKVRRFNWLDYNSADIFGKNQNKLKDTDQDNFYSDNLVRMVLNPDVMVRSRGVIEKCSFCVQKIQEGKLTAKKERRALDDGDIKSACQLACPTDAIVFGDMNNHESDVADKMKKDTTYLVLEETNVRPSVYYQMRVLNKKFEGLHADHEIEREHEDDVDHEEHHS